MYLQVYVALPNRDDFVAHLITLAHVQEVLLAQINRNALIMALETHFGCVQIFSDELTFAKYCHRGERDDIGGEIRSAFLRHRAVKFDVRLRAAFSVQAPQPLPPSP